MTIITLKLPKGITEEEIKSIVEKYIKLKLEGMKALDKLLSEKGLDDEDLEDFEEFRDELWIKKGKREHRL